MNKRFITYLLLTSLLVACNTPTPDEKKEYERILDKGYAVFYGDYYSDAGLKNNILSLDLYSSGITLDNSGRATGAGTNVYLSDIFLQPTDTFLPQGKYVTDTTAAPMTFLAGIQYEGEVSGAYLLDIKENGYSVLLVRRGEMNVSFSRDSTIIDFTLLLADSSHTVYNGQYRGKLIYYDGREKND